MLDYLTLGEVALFSPVVMYFPLIFIIFTAMGADIPTQYVTLEADLQYSTGSFFRYVIRVAACDSRAQLAFNATPLSSW